MPLPIQSIKHPRDKHSFQFLGQVTAVMIQSRISVHEGHTSTTDLSEAVSDLRQQIDGSDTSLVLFFASPSYDTERLGQQMAESFCCQIVGCTTPGALGSGGFLWGGISAVALGGALTAHSFCMDLADCDAEAARIGEEVSNILKASPGRSAFGLLLVDGLSLTEEKVAAALYQHSRPLPIIGGSAGDDLTFQETFVYSEGQMRSGIATFTLVTTDVEVTTFKFEHFVPTERIAVITDSSPKDRIIKEINGEPAVEAYARLVGVAPGSLNDRIFSMNPFVLELDGEQYIRSIAKLNPDGSLTLFCAIEDGVVLSVGRSVDPGQAAREAFDRVRESVGEPSLVIGCDCILRRLEFDNTGLLEEIGHIMAENHVVGFSTYGEQYNAIHVNQTFTGIALGT